MRRILLLLFIFPLIFSCSTKPEDEEKKNTLISSANDYMNQGNKQFSDGLFKVSLSSFEKAQGIYSGLDDIRGITAALLAQGKTYMALDSLDEAYNLISYAVHFTEMTGDPVLHRSALNVLTEYYLREQNLEKAKELCDVTHTPGLPQENEETALMHRLRGTIYKREGDLETAETELLLALSINERINNHGDAASDYYLLASLYSVRGDFAQALIMAENALEKDQFTESMLGVAADLKALGRINERAQNTEAALYYYHRAYLAWKGLERYEEMDQIARKIAELSDNKEIFLP